MQDRPRFTGTLIISILIHFGVSFLVAMFISLTQINIDNRVWSLVCYIYVPFMLSGCAIGLHPHLIRPVEAALLSASIVFIASYLSREMFAAPAILLSTLSAFVCQNFKIGSGKQS